MNQTEKNTMDNALLAKTERDKNFKISEYTNNILTKEIWYDTDNGDDTYSGKAEETTFTYQGNKIISKTMITYYYDGTENTAETWSYYENGGNRIQKKSGG